jgi:hypothetical protein
MRPSFREQRMNVKKEKQSSVLRQIESKEWLQKQSEEVENLALNARQMSSRRSTIAPGESDLF